MRKTKWITAGLLAAFLAFSLSGCTGTDTAQTTAKETTAEETSVEETTVEETTAQGVTEEEFTTEAAKTSYPLTLDIYDAEGNLVTMTYENAPQRVVSTQLSMTELLIELGLQDRIVGVMDNDNSLEGETGEIISTLTSLGNKQNISKEAILAAEPEIVLGKATLMFTETTIGTVQEYQALGISVYTELASAGVEQSLDNIIQDVKNIGMIFDVQGEANAYAAQLEDRLAQVREGISQIEGEPVKVLFMVGYADGTFSAFNSTLSSAMLAEINAVNVLEKGSGGLTLENLVALSPDYIVYVLADRYAETDTTAVENLLSSEIAADVPAIANQHIIQMSYDDVMDYGARIFDATEQLYDFIYGK